MQSANGEVTAYYQAIVRVEMLGGLQVKALILKGTATVLGMEPLCDNHGFTFLKEPRKCAVLSKGDLVVRCQSYHGVPYICPAVDDASTP